MPSTSTRFRRLLWCLVLALTGVSTAASTAWAQQAVLVVRHAEKVDESDDPLLSAAGMVRAEALARHLGAAGITAIYVTQYQRTGLTAAPIAAALRLTPIAVPADATGEMIDRIRTHHARDVVLIVGHSNTVPTVLKLLGHPEPITIRSDEFDALFVAVPREGGTPTVLKLRY